MTRISDKLLSLRKKGKSALIPYVTPEYPVPGTTVLLVHALEEAGADLIELGVPFSGPIAGGSTR